MTDNNEDIIHVKVWGEITYQGTTQAGIKVYGELPLLNVKDVYPTNGSGFVETISESCCANKKRYVKIKFQDTGEVTWVRKDILKSGQVRDITNWNNPHSNVIDETGNKYGMLTVLSQNGVVKYDHGTVAMWDCVCDCGNKITTRGSGLRSGKTSCGCIRDENTRWINYSHGDYKSPEYSAWMSMKGRCYNKNDTGYEGYGGRGIKVSDEWLDDKYGYLNFLNDMGRKPNTLHSVGRVDNDGNYCVENCRWETDEQQVNNRRRNKNNSSGRTGVKFNEKSGKWHATLSKGSRLNATNIFLGSFLEFEGAVKAREEAELKYFGRIKQ